MSADNTSPAGAAAKAGPQVQSTINVTANQGTVIGTQIINRAPAAPALHQLRAPVGDFVGRADAIAQVVQALSGGAAAVGCVRGMAGVGKTELAYTAAQQLAAAFPDAQLLVDLRGVSPTPLSPAKALQTVIRAFEREAKLPDDLEELTGLYAAALAGKRALILADDAQDAAQARALLPPPGCALLITSRNRFALPAMRAIDLDTLPPPEAAQLLLAICPRIAADADALAKECGYLPLALRIIAGLLATNDTRPVASCLARVGGARLSYMSDPDDPLAGVETSLRLSYDDLTADAQAALCQLSVFPSSFDVAAAQAVVAVAGDAGQALELLRRTSLLEWDAALERYSLQDLVRVFGAARLENADAVGLRHAQYYLQVATSAVKYLYANEDMPARLALFDRERGQIDAGLRWSRDHAGDPNADQLLVGYGQVASDVGLLRYDARTERLPQLKASLEAARRLGQKQQECDALSNLAACYIDLDDESRAIDCYEQALAIARALGDRVREAALLGNLGLTYSKLGDAPKAIEHLERRLAIARELGDKSGEAYALDNLGDAYADLDDIPKAISYGEQALALMRGLGDQGGEAGVLGSLGTAYANLDELPKAITYLEQQLAIVREIGERLNEVSALSAMGDAYTDLDDLPKAIDCYEQQLAVAREIGDRQEQAYALDSLGDAYSDRDDLPKAIDYGEQALAIMREIGDRDGEAGVLGSLALAYADLDDAPKAIAYQEQRLAIAREINNQPELALASRDLSELLADQGDLAKAVELLQVYVDFARSTNAFDLKAQAAVLAKMQRQLAGKRGKLAETSTAEKTKGAGSKRKA